MTEGKTPKDSCEFGVHLGEAKARRLRQRLELLAERAPALSKISLHFEKRKSCVKGFLTISCGDKSFQAVKAAHDPVQAFFLLEEEVNMQISNWKRTRFSTNQSQWRYT